MSIGLKGLFTPEFPETRDLAYLEVKHNGTTYDWQTYIPQGVNVGEYLQTIEQKIYNEIDAKEAAWVSLDPKTRTILDPFSGEEQIIDIQKDEIVRPDIPDYYALRRAEYPTIGDQLGAMWKGPDSVEFTDMMQKIADIKLKYPKP